MIGGSNSEETFPKEEDRQDAAFPKREGEEDRFFPNKEGIQGATFPNQEEDRAFPKREWPKREDVVSKQENTFPNWEEVFPKPIEKNNRKQEYKDNSMRERRANKPFYYLS